MRDVSFRSISCTKLRRITHRLLLREISRRTKYYNGSVIFKLDGAKRNIHVSSELEALAEQGW